MSSIGQPEPLERWDIDTASFSVADRVEWDLHVHEDQHELLWGCRGTLTVETGDGFFAVPSALGLWIPAGVSHRVTAAGGTRFTCTYVERELGSPTPHPSVVSVTELTQALLTRLEAEPYLTQQQRRHAEALTISLLDPIRTASVDVPLPTDDRPRRVADALLANPADQRSVDEWGHVVGASARNLSRLFVADTGLSFAAWRTRARMRRAVELLAADHSVAAVSRRVGYNTPSAFIQAFRRELGRTPGEFASSAPRDSSA